MKAFVKSLPLYLWVAAATKPVAAADLKQDTQSGPKHSTSDRVGAQKDGRIGLEVSGVRGGKFPTSLGAGWGWLGGGCEGEKTIPFMVTNVKLTEAGDEHYWGFYSDNFEEEMKFLKNIRYCPDAGWMSSYRIYGELISPEAYKREVESHVESSDVYDHVLYAIHGVNNEPKSSFDGAFNFNDNRGAATKYLVIPINWRNRWGTTSTYEWDRNNSAPRAGRQLAAKSDVFKSSVSTSVMCHSQGNWVFRVMAQNIQGPEQMFENVFMVAADARMDMFSTEFNPEAPQDMEAKGNTDSDDLLAENYLDIPEIELRLNGGYAISKLTSHTHVLWNRRDGALDTREWFQMGIDCGGIDCSRVMRALGRVGDESEALTTLPYFMSRVTYHDFTATDTGGGNEHSYQWLQPAVDLYVQYKPDEMLLANKLLGEDNLKID